MNSIAPEIWGPHFWNVINSIALSYPDKPNIQDQNNVASFLNSLQKVLPCEKCRNHFSENLQKYPLTQALNSRDNFINWVIDVHNSVNKTNGKRVLSYQEGINAMNDNLYQTPRYDYKYLAMMGMLVSIGVFWIFRKTKKFKK